MKNTTNTNKNTITLTSFGEFIKRYATGAEKLNLSVKCLKDNGVDTPKNIINFVQRFYVEIGAMMDLRQATGKKVDQDQLKAAESVVKEYSDNWFKLVGTRPAKTKNGTLRPCYGTTYADFAIYGECVGQAMQKANNDLTKVIDIFFEILVLNTARILNGEKLGRVTESEFRKARTAFNKAKAEKAKKTKESNAKKEAKKATEQAEVEAMKLELETLKANAIDVEKLIALIVASHATEEEKQAMLEVITGKKEVEKVA